MKCSSRLSVIYQQCRHGLYTSNISAISKVAIVSLQIFIFRHFSTSYTIQSDDILSSFSFCFWNRNRTKWSETFRNYGPDYKSKSLVVNQTDFNRNSVHSPSIPLWLRSINDQKKKARWLVRCVMWKLDAYRFVVTIQGGPKKGSHYRKSSLNRIKNRQPG